MKTLNGYLLVSKIDAPKTTSLITLEQTGNFYFGVVKVVPHKIESLNYAVGNTVFWERHSGMELEVGPEKYWVIREVDLVGILD